MNETKEHILKVSLLLFLQKSYRDVTMKEIVEKTGMSKGAFYHYFTSKEALFKEIVNMFFSMGTVDYSSFSADSLKTFYGQYIDYLSLSFLKLDALVKTGDQESSSFNLFLIMFEAVNRFPEYLHKELEIHNKDMEAWKHIIDNARKSGEIRSTTSNEDIANLFLYCTDGVFLRFVNDNKNAAFKDYLKKAYDSIYNNLTN